MEKALRRFKATVAYDGTDFLGWQSQVGGNTVQDFLEKRLRAVVRDEALRIHGSGRTDAGVHARGQIFHFDARWEHPVQHLHRALGSGYPPTIQVTKVVRAKADFHARYSATGKRYCYYIYEGEAPPFERRYCLSTGQRTLDTAAMAEAAATLLGRHDFRAYAAVYPEGPVEDPVRELRRLDIARRGRHIRITAEADGFLYKMVRSLAGALLRVGWGKLKPYELREIRESGVRTVAVETAPAQGLFLEKVFYP